MTPKIPLHTRVKFTTYGRAREAPVAGTVGKLGDVVVAYCMKDGAPRLGRIRSRGNVTGLQRRELKSVELDARYHHYATIIIDEELNAISREIRQATASRLAAAKRAVEIPGTDWVKTPPEGRYSYGKRYRRLTHEEVNGRPHEDDSTVDFVVLTQYDYQAGDQMVTSSSRQIYRCDAYFAKLIAKLNNDGAVLRGRLKRFMS